MTTHEVAGTVTVHVPPAGTELTVYVDGVPPEPGGVIDTVAEPAPAIADGVPGVPGTARVIDEDADDAPDVPPTLVAVEVNV